MNKINLIIPMNGLGNRFKQEDYFLPKPLINVLGRPMIFWLLDNLNLIHVQQIIIPYTSILDSYKFQQQLKQRYPNVDFRFVSINTATRGAAETVYVALEGCSDSVLNNRIMILDCDTFYFEDIISDYALSNKTNHIFYFHDKQQIPLYSYITLKEGIVTDIKEKIKISDNANTGAYCFESGKQLLSIIEKVLQTEHVEHNEYYISGIYKLIIKDKITASLVNDFVCVGTPTQLKIFCETYTKVTPQRFCFDLDNTLVTKPNVDGDYASCDPIEENINFLKHLHKQGHYIIIYTARRMRTHSGNVNAVIKDIGKLTLDQLEAFGIPFDEIQFGKPWADFYVDDLAVNCNHNLEKQLGYYNTSIKSRSFNTVEILDNMVIKSGKIDGERFYYKQIKQTPVKDLFPELLEDTSDKLIIQRIKGVNFSHLYCTRSLTEDVFRKFLSSVRRLHSIEMPSIDSTAANRKKVVDRYTKYDYNKFEGHRQTLEQILMFFQEYQTTQSTVIHGDCVFTNILIDENDQIKMIDMRGKVGDQYAIYGDPIYDLAKIYQSLTGYDFILNSVTGNVSNNLVNIFCDWVNQHYNITLEDIKKYTASLYFSLIPLHNDEKCYQYYKLAQKLINQ